MPPLPLNQDGTINTSRLNFEQDRDSKPYKKKSSSKSVANSDAIDDINEQIKDLKAAYEESSGFKRKELKVRIQEAEKEREARIQAANISAEASKYGSDKSLEGTKYSSDAGERNSQRSADASRFSAQLGLQGTQYSSDAGERNAARSAGASMYGADSSAAASRYGTDADLYKFAAEQPNKRAQTALSFLNTYATMAGQPSNFLQASQYGRLGRQVEGMPGMIQDLLGEVNPNALPAGGNVAFRVGTADMPQNQAMSVFGANPLGLVSTRSAQPSMPVWSGPVRPPDGSEYVGTMGVPDGGAAYAPESVVGMMGVPDAGASPQPMMMRTAFAPVAGYGQQYAQQPQAHRERYVKSYGAAAGAQAVQPQQGYGQGYGQNQPYRAAGYYEAPTAQVQGNPSILDGGRVVADYDPTEEQFKSGVRTLMQRGAHRWGNQALERMTGTERAMLESGIKDAGGVPADYFEAYARSRIGNEGAGRAL